MFLQESVERNFALVLETGVNQSLDGEWRRGCKTHEGYESSKGRKK